MADTSFTDYVTNILSSWLNVVNNFVYKGRNPNYVTSTGAANTYTLTLPTGSLLANLTAGDTFVFKAHQTNTGAATITIVGSASLGPYNLVDSSGAALVSGALPVNALVAVRFDGTNFQVSTVTNIASTIHTATSKTTPIDADETALWDSVTQTLQKLTWANLKATLKTYFDTLYVPVETMDFRLTLTTGTPVTTADVAAVTTIYCTPYKGNRIALYTGSAWVLRTSAEFSLALGTLVSGKPYDVFCYDNAGVPTLEFLVWTDDTTRATALAYQDGVLVKTGAATRRYIGTFYTISTTQTCDSSTIGRYLWNYYNRVIRNMFITDATANWTYSTATIRQANGNTANQLNFVQGVSEDSVQATVASINTNSANINSVGIGLDSTTVFSSGTASNGSTSFVTCTVPYEGVPSAGRHYLTWLEYASGATGTWLGTTTFNRQSSLVGRMLA